MSEDNYRDNEEREYGKNTKNDSTFVGKFVLFLVSLLFIPAFILGFLMYHVLLRTLRQKVSVIFVVLLGIILSAFVIWNVTDAGDKFLGVVENWRNIGTYWTNLIPAWVSVNILLGGIGGFVTIFSTVRTMKSNPHLFELSGSWMYKFKFRRTPFEVYKRHQKIKKLQEGKYQHEERIPLGIDEDDNIVYRYYTEMPQSTVISGTTGSGKTITMLNSMLSDIINGVSIVVIDFKRSKEFSSKLAQWSSEYGRDFYHFEYGSAKDYKIKGSPGQASYDPLKNAGDSKSDIILGMREYDTAAAVYKQNMREFLQTLFYIMKHVDKRKTKNIKWDQGELYALSTIVNGLNGSAFGNLIELIDATAGTEAEIIARDFELKVKKSTSGLHQAFEAFKGQIDTLINSPYGQWLRYSENGRNIDLYKLLLNKGNVVLFSMDALSGKDFAKYMGSLIMSDLSAVSAKRLEHSAVDNHINIYIDEFQALSPSSLAPILEKSRGSGFGTTMASQSYEQIISAAESNGEAQLNSILDTCANFIVHAGATERSAKRLSDIAGQEEKTVYSKANQNESSIFSWNWSNKRNQRVQTSTKTDWIAPPSAFMNLSMPKKANNFETEAVIVKKSSDDPAESGKKGVVIKKVLMIPSSKVLEKYSDDEEFERSEPEERFVEEKSDVEILNDKDFDIPEAPLNYMAEKGYVPDDHDELDDFEDDELSEEEAEERDGGFTIEELEDEDDDLLNSVNIDEYIDEVVSEDRPERKDSVMRESSRGLPVRRQSLPTRAPERRSEAPKSSFGAMVGSEDFKPAKRLRERPPIVDKDDDLDDALPDYDF